jgi:hypothetical protein
MGSPAPGVSDLLQPEYAVEEAEPVGGAERGEPQNDHASHDAEDEGVPGGEPEVRVERRHEEHYAECRQQHGDEDGRPAVGDGGRPGGEE